MNPFYDHFKSLIGEGIGDNDDNIGDIYRSIMYQRGYGFDDEFVDYDATYGLGFGEVLSNVFRLATPLLKKGLQYLGNQAVSTVANIAQDAIAGQNVAESAKKHVSHAAGDVFAKAPAAIANSVLKTRGIKRGPDSSLEDVNWGRRSRQKRIRKNIRGKIGRGLLQEYPALKKIN